MKKETENVVELDVDLEQDASQEFGAQKDNNDNNNNTVSVTSGRKAYNIAYPMNKKFLDILSNSIPNSLHQAPVSPEACRNEMVKVEILNFRETLQTLDESFSS